MRSRVEIDLGELSNTCFVIMPFQGLFQAEYERVIRPAVELAGLRCIRGDEIYSKPNILEDIWGHLRQARLVIAELTGRNANVFYEIGLAHALGKPVILLTRNEDDVPFDLRSLRYRFYDTNDPEWGEHLVTALRDMLEATMTKASLSHHLQGISVTASYPESPRHPTVGQLTPAAREVAGHWAGKWIEDGVGIPASGVMLITQDGAELAGAITISFEKRDQQTVIHEALVGRIDGRSVSLSGASYTYLQRGASTQYEPDFFDLQLSDDGLALLGHAGSGKDKGKVEFKRAEAVRAPAS